MIKIKTFFRNHNISMKKTRFFGFSSLLIFLTLITTSCKKNKNADVIPVRAPEVKTLSPQDLANAPVDIDLTAMSSTMVLAEVFNMIIMPEEYEGKIVKANGPFLVFQNPENNDRFFAILIEDATKCCQQGIDFVWSGEHSYPEDYPPENQEIVVTGVYHSIEYDTGVTYNYLEVFDLEG